MKISFGSLKNNVGLNFTAIFCENVFKTGKIYIIIPLIKPHIVAITFYSPDCFPELEKYWDSFTKIIAESVNCKVSGNPEL